MERNLEFLETNPENNINNFDLSTTSEECDNSEVPEIPDTENYQDVEEEFQDVEQEQNYFSSLYKKTGGLSNQSKRREDLLKEQRSRRNKLTDSARGILNEDVEDKMESETIQTYHRHKFKKYRNKIMLSEWFTDIPEDLGASWFLKVCPSGHRCLVVAVKRSTKSYSRNGDFESEFNSVLPGGNSIENSQKSTILDCIWIFQTKQFYVLDVLTWSGQNLMEYDAEFRFFWLQSRINEIEELSLKTGNNTYPFILTPHVSCEYASIVEQFETFPKYTDNIPTVDGALFYHREASYTSGKTPLVGWLKPYMIPEILNIPISQEYLAFRPSKYVSLKQHIEYANSYKKNKSKVRKEVMETE